MEEDRKKALRRKTIAVAALVRALGGEEALDEADRIEICESWKHPEAKYPDGKIPLGTSCGSKLCPVCVPRVNNIQFDQITHEMEDILSSFSRGMTTVIEFVFKMGATQFGSLHARIEGALASLNRFCLSRNWRRAVFGQMTLPVFHIENDAWHIELMSTLLMKTKTLSEDSNDHVTEDEWRSTWKRADMSEQDDIEFVYGLNARGTAEIIAPHYFKPESILAISEESSRMIAVRDAFDTLVEWDGIRLYPHAERLF